MIKRIIPYKITEEEKLEIEVAKWAFDSHFWIEQKPGSFVCKWCGRVHESSMSIRRGYPLCSENPSLKNFIIQSKRGE